MKYLNLKKAALAVGLCTTLNVSAQFDWDYMRAHYPNLFSKLDNWPGGTGPIAKGEIGTDAYTEACYSKTSTWHVGGDNVYPAVNPIYPFLDVAQMPPPQFNIGTCNEFPFVLKANNKERIFITPQGNVGVGENNNAPSAALDVSDGNSYDHLKIYGDLNGSIESSGDMNLYHQGVFYISAGTPNSSTTLFGAGVMGVGVFNRDFLIWDGSNNLNFKVTPNGMVYAREVEITLSNFPDYVFDKNYKLPKISEVAKYIEQNKHLPGFEKGEYYEKNGVNVNNMLVKQQEKIEELTLYIIELEKRLRKLEK